MSPRLEQWSNLRLRTKGLIVVAFPAAATVMIACAAYLIGSLAENAAIAVKHTLEVSQELEKLQIYETQTSAVARAYFISHDDVFRGRVRESMASFDSSRQKIDGLTADNPQQQRLLAEIAGMERSRVERIFADFTRDRVGALSPRELAESLRAAEHQRLDMEKLIASIFDEEQNLLHTRTEHFRALRSRMRAVIGVSVVFGVLGGLIISVLFASGITSRIGKLQENVATLAAGGAFPCGPAGRDEIGLLGEGMACAAEILRQKTAALENALHGIAQVDAQGRYLSFNKVFGEILGLSDFRGPADLPSSVHREDVAAVEQAMATVRLQGRGEVEARIPRADGAVLDVAMTFLPVSADLNSGCHIFLRDISLQRKAEAELIRAKDAAVASNHAKTDFLAKVSHDIRTPLNAILGSADLLAQTDLDRDQTEYVSMFQRNSRRLVALINDFLDFARIEAGGVRVERIAFRPRAVVDDVAGTFRESASRKGVALQVEIAADVPELAVGDSSRIQQVLTNFLSNALKFIRAGEVTVRLKVTGAEPSPRLRYEVADSGPGIAAGDQEKVFAPFTQLPDQSATSIRGSGLGLTICRELVQLMDGEIGLESKEGVGSTFYFHVPLERAHAGGTMPEPSPMTQPFRRMKAANPVRILIAEDTEDNRLLLALYLRDQPVVLEFAANGQEAVEAVRRPGDFDLILMDIDMPILDGRTATRQIREWEKGAGRRATPVVALSAHAVREECRLCFKAGCVAHVAKPVDQATLIATIERFAQAPLALAPVERVEVSREVAALVPKYLASKPREIEEALAHLAGGDLEPIRRFAHNLKGTGRGYGFPEIEELGRAIEESAEKDDEAGIAGQLSALHRFVHDASMSVV
jgi:PAS domain S-box-containing protein